MTLSVGLPQGYYGVDPMFREDYEMLGGAEILGPAISPPFEMNNVHYQYTAAALLKRDANAGQNNVFHLAALGLDMGIAEPPIPEPPDPDGRYVDGHVIKLLFCRYMIACKASVTWESPLQRRVTTGRSSAPSSISRTWACTGWRAKDLSKCGCSIMAPGNVMRSAARRKMITP